jgi:hypothetical protein
MARMFDPATGECRLVDDLDFSQAVQTVHFRLDGVHYEIALSAQNMEKLRASLRQYIAASRIVGRDKPQSITERPTAEAKENHPGDPARSSVSGV